MRNTDKTPQIPDALIEAQGIANLTDTAVRIPLLGIRLGLDFLVGLIPVVGDVIMAVVSLRIVHLGRKIGVPKTLQRMMLRNLVLDFLLGLLPVVGDVVDVFFKANKANVRMMEGWWLEQNAKALRESTKQKLQNWQIEETD